MDQVFGCDSPQNGIIDEKLSQYQAVTERFVTELYAHFEEKLAQEKELRLDLARQVADLQNKLHRVCLFCESLILDRGEGARHERHVSDVLQTSSEVGCPSNQCFGGHQNTATGETIRAYFKKSADEGNPFSQEKYGDFLMHEVIATDPAFSSASDFSDWTEVVHTQPPISSLTADSADKVQEAAHYYLRAAQQGFVNVDFKCAFCHENGHKSPTDLEIAARYYKLAGDSGDAYAQNRYALCLKHGSGVEVNVEESIRYFKLSVDQNFADAQNNYGICLEHGHGLEKDEAKARDFYKLSADQGHAPGQYNYGVCLRDGKGGARDFASAAAYFKQAADQGHVFAEYTYGLCLESGLGVSRNTEIAAFYFDRSIQHGFRRARNRYIL